MDKLLELFPQDIIEFLEANEVDRPVSGGIVYTPIYIYIYILYNMKLIYQIV